jgi:hypothetical protein
MDGTSIVRAAVACGRASAEKNQWRSGILPMLGNTIDTVARRDLNP